MISHRNVIANAIQMSSYEAVARKKQGIDTQVEMGLLPLSHIYGLVVIAHAAVYRGDEIVILPKFELETFLAAVQRFKVEHIPVVSRPDAWMIFVAGLTPTRCLPSSFDC